MKKIFLIVVFSVLIIGCASSKNYVWMKGNNLASDEEIQYMEKECQYTQKMDIAKRSLSAAMSTARYETTNNSSSNKFANEATDIIIDATTCYKKLGFSREEK